MNRTSNLREASPPPFDLVPFPAEKPKTTSRLLQARDTAEQQAWSSLARYKFWMFGYHAAQWVLLNRVAEKAHRQKNPFRELVWYARKRAQT